MLSSRQLVGQMAINLGSSEAVEVRSRVENRVTKLVEQFSGLGEGDTMANWCLGSLAGSSTCS